MRRSPKAHGFTLVELLLVICIVSLLGLLGFPAFGFLRKKAAGAVCLSNMRTIGTSLNLYLTDHNGVWPQVPLGDLDREEAEAKWWENTMREYGLGRKHWICPVDTPLKKPGIIDGTDEFVSSYAVTPFDEYPGTAYRWKQPWIIERASFHGSKDGPNMYMPDGTFTQGMAMPIPGVP